MMIGTALRGPLRVSIGVFWLVGAAVAGITTVLAAVRLGTTASVPFAVPDLGLPLLAVQTFRGARWALVIDLVLLAGFVMVVGGSLWELRHVDPGKAGQLRAMGFDPSFGVGFQLGYSVAGVALFVWAAVRLMPLVRRHLRR